jgi:hypothetical protein
MNPLARVLLTVILGDSDWFEVLWIGLVSDDGSEGGEAVSIIVIVVPAGTVPSPCFSDKPASQPSLVLCLSSIVGVS